MPNFFERFEAARTDATPQGLQLLFFAPPVLEAEAIAAMLNDLPGVADARCEMVRVSDFPEAKKFVSDAGPPASKLGWGEGGSPADKIVHWAEPMPYGPVESCVGPALLPPPMKVDAAQHKAHVLLYYAGTHPD